MYKEAVHLSDNEIRLSSNGCIYNWDPVFFSLRRETVDFVQTIGSLPAVRVSRLDSIIYQHSALHGTVALIYQTVYIMLQARYLTCTGFYGTKIKIQYNTSTKCNYLALKIFFINVGYI